MGGSENPNLLLPLRSGGRREGGSPAGATSPTHRRSVRTLALSRWEWGPGRVALCGLLLFLVGCHHTQAPQTAPEQPAVRIDSGRVSTADNQVSFRPPDGWDSQAVGSPGILLAFAAPAGTNQGARLVLGCRDVPGGDVATVAAGQGKVLAEDLAVAWRGSGCRVVRQSTRPVGGGVATVIESRLTDAGRSVAQVQYVVLRGSRCWVLCGTAPEKGFAAARPAFDQAADSLRFDEGGRG